MGTLPVPMRRLSFILLASLIAAPAALAERSATGDGSLLVSDASALTIIVQGNGLIFGHIYQGSLTVVEYTPADDSSLQVSGSMTRLAFGSVVRYAGADVRFFFPNGRYSLRFEGFGIDVSAVGRGVVSATGLGSADDGTLATNGGKERPLGQGTTTLVFGAGKGPRVAPSGLARGQAR